MQPIRRQSSFLPRVLLAALLLLSVVGLSQAAEPDAPVAQQNLEDHVAIHGYDPVAYFESKSAVKGSDKIFGGYKGVTYRFSSNDNKKKFLDDPTKYLPTYGGWCATAMADGSKVDIDPTNFKLTNGRLFLFYKGWLGDAQKDWNKDENNMRSKADAAWAKIISSK